MPAEKRKAVLKFSGLLLYNQPEIRAPSPIPSSRKIYIVAKALPLKFSRDRSTTQAVVVGLYMPTAAPKSTAEPSSISLLVAKATAIIANTMTTLATRITFTRPIRSDALPAINRIPREESVKTAKNSPLFLMPRKLERSGIKVRTTPKEKTDKKRMVDGSSTRFSRISFFSYLNKCSLSGSFLGSVSFRRSKIRIEKIAVKAAA